MNTVGEVDDDLHVVFDPDHGNAEPMLDAQDEARQVLALVAIEPGRRLIEQQQGRLERECAGETDKLLGAERERADRNMTEPLELDELDDRFNRRALAHFLTANA